MKATEVRAMSVEDLEKKLADLKKDLFNLRLQLIGALDDLLIQGVGHTVGNGHHHGLVHLIGNHQADSGLAGRSSVFHVLVPPLSGRRAAARG